MSLHLLHDDPSYQIWYDYLDEWLYVDWIGDQSFETVQAGCLAMLDHLVRERCHKVLNDNRRVTNMWNDAAEWGGKVWFPMMADAGLEYFAWVYSANIYSRLSTDQMLGYTTRPMALPFDNIDTAKAWLKQM